MSDSKNNLACQDLNKRVNDAQVQVNKAQRRQPLYYNSKRREMEFNFRTLLEKLWFGSHREKKMAKIWPKFVSPFKMS